MAELTETEAQINRMYSKLDGVLRKWQQAQLTEIANFKREKTSWEEKLLAQDAKLQSLIYSDIDIETLMTKLTLETPDPVLKPPGIPKQNRYNFAERCEMLSDRILTEISSPDF